MTEPAAATPEPAAATPEPAARPLDATALFAEAAGKSGLLWIEVPGDRAWPAWHAWADERVYLVSGPGEQSLPWLPAEVTLILRSKDTGGRLLAVRATVRTLTPGDDLWEPATEALKASRLNAVGDVVQRWAHECTVRVLQPFGELLQAPGSYPQGSLSAPVPPSEATTTGWRPWHLGGRPLRRRGTRLPDQRGDGG